MFIKTRVPKEYISSHDKFRSGAEWQQSEGAHDASRMTSPSGISQTSSGSVSLHNAFEIRSPRARSEVFSKSKKKGKEKKESFVYAYARGESLRRFLDVLRSSMYRTFTRHLSIVETENDPCTLKTFLPPFF
jgi:hypothetical protein